MVMRLLSILIVISGILSFNGGAVYAAATPTEAAKAFMEQGFVEAGAILSYWNYYSRSESAAALWLRNNVYFLYNRISDASTSVNWDGSGPACLAIATAPDGRVAATIMLDACRATYNINREAGVDIVMQTVAEMLDGDIAIEAIAAELNSSILNVAVRDQGIRFNPITNQCEVAAQRAFNGYYPGPCGDLHGLSLGSWSFVGMDLRGAIFRETNFASPSTFPEPGIVGMFSFSDLSYSDFSNALVSGSFHQVTAISANFRNSDLANVYFTGADLRHADFTMANLYGAEFQDANLEGALLDHADLSNARFNHATVLPFTIDVALARGMIYDN